MLCDKVSILRELAEYVSQRIGAMKIRLEDCDLCPMCDPVVRGMILDFAKEIERKMQHDFKIDVIDERCEHLHEGYYKKEKHYGSD